MTLCDWPPTKSTFTALICETTVPTGSQSYVNEENTDLVVVFSWAEKTSHEEFAAKEYEPPKSSPTFWKRPASPSVSRLESSETRMMGQVSALD